MYNPPWFVWAVSLVGTIGFPAVTCLVLYRGARAAGSARTGAALLAGAAGVVLSGWLAASAEIAARGYYQGTLDRPPWLGIAAGTSLVCMLAMSRIPAVARALDGPKSLSRITLPHAFRVAGASFLILLALGHLSALFALPAGLGDIAIGIEAPFVARRLARGTGHRGATWFTVLGIVDLVNALALGGLTGYGIVHVPPSNDALAALPIVLIPTVGVPLLLVLHIVSLRSLVAMSRSRRRSAAQLAAALA